EGGGGGGGGGGGNAARQHVRANKREAQTRKRRPRQARSDRAQGEGRHRTVDRAGLRHAVSGCGWTAHAVLRAGGTRLRAAYRDGWPRRDRQRGGAVAIDPRLQLWRSSPLKPTGADLGATDRYPVRRKSAPDRAGDMVVTA